MQVTQSFSTMNLNEMTTHEKIYDVSWKDYEVKLLTLALKIHKSGWIPDSILCIGRGGLQVGDALSRLFHKTIGVVMCSSYQGEGERIRGKLNIAEHVSIIGQLKGRVILIDDLVDSGVTLVQTRDWILEKFPGILEMRTGVVFSKTHTDFMPDYFVEKVDAERWIFLPNEIFDRINLEQLSKNALADIPDDALFSLATSMLENLPIDPRMNLTSGEIYQCVNQGSLL